MAGTPTTHDALARLGQTRAEQHHALTALINSRLPAISTAAREHNALIDRRVAAQRDAASALSARAGSYSPATREGESRRIVVDWFHDVGPELFDYRNGRELATETLLMYTLLVPLRGVDLDSLGLGDLLPSDRIGIGAQHADSWLIEFNETVWRRVEGAQKARRIGQKIVAEALGVLQWWPETETMTTDEHPSQTLLHALNGLHLACSNAPLFRELAERRKRVSDMQLNLLNARAKVAGDRANELARRGAPVQEQWAILNEAMAGWDEPPPSNEPAALATNLREILDGGRAWIDRARAALRAGGARVLDAAMNTNAAERTRSIELYVWLLDADGVFRCLSAGVSNPSISFDREAATMADLAERFSRATDELQAVLATNGLEAPPARPAEVDIDRLAIERAAELAAERTANKLAAGHGLTNFPGSTRSRVVLWEGAEPSERNLKLARTRSAYLEAHGNVRAAMDALREAGHGIGRSTFYEHLDALDAENRGWRTKVLDSAAAGIPENGVRVRTRGKSGAKSR